MKKHFLFIPVLVMCLCMTQSCVPALKCPAPTLNGSVQFSRLPGQQKSFSNAIGAQGGVAFNAYDNFKVPVALRAGLNVSMQGAKYEDDYGAGLIDGMTRLTYLNIPLVGRYSLPSGFYGEAGLQPGFLLAAKDKFEDQSYDYRDWIKSFDLSIPISVGYEFPNNIGVGVIFVPGVTDINKSEYDSGTIRNMVLGLRVSYTFLEKE